MITAYQDYTFQETLVAEGLITPFELARLLAERQDTTEPIGNLLVRLGRLTERDKVRCLGKQMGVPFVDVNEREIDLSVAQLIPQAMAVRLKALPIERSAMAISVAMANPLDIAALDELQAVTGLPVDPVIATEEAITESIHRLFGADDNLGDLIGEALSTMETRENAGPQAVEMSLGELRKMSEGAPVIRLVNAVIGQAVASRASDIHITPEQARVRIRFRVDGLLQEVMMLPMRLSAPLISRMKIMAQMDIAEHRAPQDGRISLNLPQGEYDFRVSTYPSLHGENMVIRILDKNAGRISMETIGMAPDVMARLRRLIGRPYGMFIVCGPTGSGKTTTLYACLNALNTPERNIMTIEDPIEYQMPGIVQGNINPKAGVTFSSGLRTLVRQDPDVILVGEIRDSETASIALEAALTGHLVLSTLHANDAAGAVTRLMDLGVEPFLIASALVASLAQRLLRVVCPKCAAPYTPEADLIDQVGCADLMQNPGFQFRRGAGCSACSRTGYRGRTGVHELMEITPEVQRMVLARATPQQIREVALRGTRTMREDAIEKIRLGLTTPEETFRMTVR